MTAVTLLDRLEGVRQTGPGRWLAKCPAHEDRRASLSIREVDDRLLIHDFAGCDVREIMAALDLDLSVLFAERTGSGAKGRGRRRAPHIPATDCLRAVSFESDLVAICAGRLANGHPLTDDERHRLMVAARRIGAATLEAGCHA